MVDAWKLADEVVASSSACQNVAAHDRVKRLGDACHKACKEVFAAGEEILEGCNHDTYKRSIYKPQLEKGDPQQINVKVGGEFLDIAAISPLVASAASFNIHRVYHDDQVEGLEDELAKRLQRALKKKLHRSW
jgi:hypothetical protein